MADAGKTFRLRIPRKLLGALGILMIAGAVGPLAAGAQQPPVDPDQLKSQLSQALARIVLERPTRLAQRAAEVAAQSQALAQDLLPRLQAGRGPNGGPPPPGLDVEIGQIVAEAGACAQAAGRNLQGAGQDLQVLQGVLGGQLDLDGDPSPETSLQILSWLSVQVEQQRIRNAAIEECVEHGMYGLGRLRAYRTLY